MTDYKLVPVEPTPEMLEAGEYAQYTGCYVSGIYADMLAAAPAVQGEPPRHPATPLFFEYPSFEESADFDPEPAQQPEERETPGSYPISGQIFFREPSNEWVLELTGSVNGTTFAARHTQPADTRPEDVAGLPALYESTSDITKLVEALTELCDEIDNHEIHAAISKTNILWFKRKARAALAAHRKGGEA